MNETFVGEAITPQDASFSASPMATGAPGLPQKFSWQGQQFSVTEVLEEWKEAGDCRHGSGERYVRKHWFRVRTTGGLEMKIYFERQGRSAKSRWRLYTVCNVAPGSATTGDPTDPTADATAVHSCSSDRLH